MEFMHVQIGPWFVLISKRVFKGIESETILTPRGKSFYLRLRGGLNM